MISLTSWENWLLSYITEYINLHIYNYIWFSVPRFSFFFRKNPLVFLCSYVKAFNWHIIVYIFTFCESSCKLHKYNKIEIIIHIKTETQKLSWSDWTQTSNQRQYKWSPQSLRISLCARYRSFAWDIFRRFHLCEILRMYLYSYQMLIPVFIAIFIYWTIFLKPWFSILFWQKYSTSLPLLFAQR